MSLEQEQQDFVDAIRADLEQNGRDGAVPLLDEIAAHLDINRRAALFDLVDRLGGQAFMTGTDQAMFEALGDRGRFLTVSQGSVTG